MSRNFLLTALCVACVLGVSSFREASAGTVPPAEPVCSAPGEFVGLNAPLWRTRAALSAGEPVVIVAIGSSSTAGAGASSPAHSYPARLESELRAHFPGADITVLNRGVNGEDAADMLARFESTVIQERPDLVIWQVGTNAVLRDHKLDGESRLIRDGITRLKAAQSDIVLMDSQYAPKVLAKPDIFGMVDLMAKTAREQGTGLFRRFAMMRHWRETRQIPFETLLSPDGLHMNDWSYGCVAKILAQSIFDAVRTPAGVARAPSTRRN